MSYSIKKRVGPGAANEPDDVRVVQSLLQRHSEWLGELPAPLVTGTWDAKTGAAIVAFQREGAAVLKPDGAVDPNGFTLKRLNQPVIEGPSHKVFKNVCWAHGAGIGA